MYPGMASVSETMHGPRMFGSTWRNTIRRFPAPRARADSMYSFCFTESVCARARRAMPIQLRTPSATNRKNIPPSARSMLTITPTSPVAPLRLTALK